MMLGRSVLVLVFALLVPAAGCGTAASTPLEGSVTLAGKALNRGTLILVGPDGRIESANLSGDGTYRLPQAPVGQVRVAVQVPFVATPRPGRNQPVSAAKAREAAAEGEVLTREATVPEDLSAGVAVPAKFQDPETSGLLFEIAPGQTQLDIELAPT